jgi:hypothetical protein
MKDNKEYINGLLETRTYLNKVRNINEAMSFDEDYDIETAPYEGENYDDMEDVENEDNISIDNECDSDLPNEIDTIREIALKGMLKHVKNSKSPEYETLKKIFQFCDKVNNDKPENAE